MTKAETINLKNIIHNESVKHVNNDNNKTRKGQVSPIYLAWLYMLESVQVQEGVAQEQATALQINADDQMQINSEEAKINFIQINTNLSKSKLEIEVPQVQEENQEIQKRMEFLSNGMVSLRQKAQIGETEVNTSVNDTEQTQQEAASQLQMVTNLTNQIMR